MEVLAGKVHAPNKRSTCNVGDCTTQPNIATFHTTIIPYRFAVAYSLSVELGITRNKMVGFNQCILVLYGDLSWGNMLL